MPHAVMNLLAVSIKLLNNCLRIDMQLCQMMINRPDNILTFNNAMNRLLQYCMHNEVKDLLHEITLLIGYYCLMNDEARNIINKGEDSILIKLCSLPIRYWKDKKFKDILFPTMICATYKHKLNTTILNE